MSARRTARAVDVVQLAAADLAVTLANLDRLAYDGTDDADCVPRGRLLVVERVDDAVATGHDEAGREAGHDGADAAAEAAGGDALRRGLEERVGEVGVVRLDQARLDRTSAAAVVGATVGTMWTSLLLQVPRRLGAAAATNLALQVLRVVGPASYFWLVDGSVEAMPGLLAALMATCQNDRSIGLCAATEVTEAGCRPAGHQRARWSGRRSPLPTLGAGRVDAALRARVEARLDAVDATALFGTRRALFELGDMRVDHLAPFDGHDLGARARRAGLRLGWSPEAHFRRTPATAEEAAVAPFDTYLETRGAVALAALHRPGELPFVAASHTVSALARAAQRDLSGAQDDLRGVIDGIRHRPPPGNTDFA